MFVFVELSVQIAILLHWLFVCLVCLFFLLVTFVLIGPVVYWTFKMRHVVGGFLEKRPITVSAYLCIMDSFVFVAEETLQSTPDIHYLIVSIEVHLMFTLVLTLFFGEKIYLVLTGRGNERKRSWTSPNSASRRGTISLLESHSDSFMQNTHRRASLGHTSSGSLARDGSMKHKAVKRSFSEGSKLTMESHDSSMGMVGPHQRTASGSDSDGEVQGWPVYITFHSQSPNVDVHTRVELTPLEEGPTVTGTSSDVSNSLAAPDLGGASNALVDAATLARLREIHSSVLSAS